METGELEKQVRTLLDIEAIKQLKAEYCAICDDGHDPDRIGALFAEDGVWEGKGIARAEGREEIRELFRSFAENISFSQHNVFNPRIEVNGDTAHASWYLLGPFTFREGKRQNWLAARYEDDCVRVDGTWKFQHLRAIGRMSAPYEKGWESRPEPGPLADPDPD